MWPSKLLQEIPSNEFDELCAIADSGELLGLERTDYMLAQVAFHLAAESGKSVLDYMPFPNTALDDQIEAYLERKHS